MSDLHDEGSRQFSACNACRYCEGYCPVWPAMERRSAFGKNDLNYLANICHDCQACYYACPYTPPHEANINIPKLLGEIRLSSYKEYARPRTLARLFERHRRWMLGASLFSVFSMILVAVSIGPPSRLLTSHLGPGSFYEIFPYVGIAAGGLLLGAYILAIYATGFLGFFSAVRGPGGFTSIGAVLGGARDAFAHNGFRGGGAGCYHDRTLQSNRFMILHIMLFYGFVLALASTITATVYQDGLGILPPYPVISLPVALGTAGGVLMVIGAAFVIYYKLAGATDSALKKMNVLDFAFLMNLILVSVTGLALLGLRDTTLMGLAFAIHMGFVLTLFVTAPYGKSVHFVYRYASLVINRLEEMQEAG